MEHDMLRRFGCALCALAFALTALPTAAFAQQPEEQAAVQQSLSATDVREMQQADAAVTALTGGSDYAQMTEDERTDAALQQLDALTAQGLVKQGSVYTDAENGMISFTYSCGALGGILLTDPEEENTAALPELDESRLQELAENKRVGTAAIYYAFDNTINSTRYPYYAYMQTYWDSVGLQTDLDTTVTVCMPSTAISSAVPTAAMASCSARPASSTARTAMWTPLWQTACWQAVPRR